MIFYENLYIIDSLIQTGGASSSQDIDKKNKLIIERAELLLKNIPENFNVKEVNE